MRLRACMLKETRCFGLQSEKSWLFECIFFAKSCLFPENNITLQCKTKEKCKTFITFTSVFMYTFTLATSKSETVYVMTTKDKG